MKRVLRSEERRRSIPVQKEETMTSMTTDVGQTLPDLSLPRLEGGDFQFADLRGKKLLLFMWGSW